MALQDKYIKPFTDFGLKYYRDLKNVVDTSFDEGKAEGKDERNLEIARQMKAKGMDANLIAEIIGLSISELEKLS